MYVKRSKYIGLVHFVLVISVLISGIGVFSVSALDSFPSATILDTFNRANGVIGTGWSGDIACHVSTVVIVRSSEPGPPSNCALRRLRKYCAESS